MNKTHTEKDNKHEELGGKYVIALFLECSPYVMNHSLFMGKNLTCAAPLPSPLSEFTTFNPPPICSS